MDASTAFRPRIVDADVTDAFFSQVESYEADKLKSMRRQRNGAFIGMGIGLVTAGLMAAALAGLAPLKSVEPMVFVVDRATGIVDRNVDISGDSISDIDSVNRSFAATYVRYREGFVAEELDEINRTVAAFSSSEEYARYLAWMKAPSGPPQQYAGLHKAIVKVKIRSVFLLSDPSVENKRGIMQVRFDRAEIVPGEDASAYWGADGGCVGKPNPNCRAWIAKIDFERVPGSLPESVRLRNPLGWVATSYASAAEAH